MSSTNRPNYQNYKDKAWFQDQITDERLPQRTRSLLESKGLSQSEVLPHIQSVRDRGFADYPWPCVGNFQSLDFGMCEQPDLPEILQRLKSEPDTKLVDAGCGMGQELRHLITYGVSLKQVHGLDLKPGLLQLGCDLFHDETSMKPQLIAMDMLKTPLPPPVSVRERFDFVYAGWFLHIFELESQTTAAKFLVSMLNPKPGSIIFGRQIGITEAQVLIFPPLPTGKAFTHDEESFHRFWDEVSSLTGTKGKWEVNVRLRRDLIEGDKDGCDVYREVFPEVMLLTWSIRRVEA